MEIKLATRRDIPEIMALEARYYIGNLAKAERADGFISILHSEAWFRGAVDSFGVHVAVDEQGTVVGFFAVTNPPEPSDSGISPIMKSMLELAASVTFGGTIIAQQRYAFRGPVLIDRTARGRGLYSAFNVAMRETYRDRFDVGVLFVAADNPRSLHTVSSKLGAESLASFTVNSEEYEFLAFRF